MTVADEIFNKTCTLCSYCFRRIQNNDIPSISIKHNNLLIELVPEVLNCLSSIEKKMICFVEIFMTLIVLPGGQFAEKGLVLNLPTDVQNIANQLPRKCENLDLITAHFVHQDRYETDENLRYKVSPSRLRNALIWLKENNNLYQNIKIVSDFENCEEINNSTLDLDDFEYSTVTPMNASIPISNLSSFVHNKDPVNRVPSITENPVHIFDMENGEEMAYPWLFPKGKYGLNYPRPIKIPCSMYFKQRLYHKSGHFRKNMTYLLHSAVSLDISLLKSEINLKMRIRKDRSNSGLVTAGEI